MNNETYNQNTNLSTPWHGAFDLETDMETNQVRVVSTALRLPDGSLEQRLWEPEEFSSLYGYLEGRRWALWNAWFDVPLIVEQGASFDRIQWDDLMLWDVLLLRWRKTKLVRTGHWFRSLATVADEFRLEAPSDKDVGLTFKLGEPLTDEQRTYALLDAKVTLELAERLYREAAGYGNLPLLQLFSGAQRTLIRMQINGLPIDRDVLYKQIDAAEQHAQQLRDELLELAHKFGIEAEKFSYSPKLLREMFEKEGIVPGTSFRKEILAKYPQSVVGAKLTELRSTEKVSMYRDLIPENGKVQPVFNLGLTSTGRVSVGGALQNFPPQVKESLRPRQDHVLVTTDYSQAELRLLADLAQDRHMQHLLATSDLHTETANRLFTPEQREALGSKARRRAKAVNFGVVYGLSAPGLASKEDVTLEEAKAMLEEHRRIFPDVARWLQERDDQLSRWLDEVDSRVDLRFSLQVAKAWAENRMMLSGLRKNAGRNYRRTQAFAALRDKGVDPKIAEAVSFIPPRSEAEPMVLDHRGYPVTFEAFTQDRWRFPRVFEVPVLVFIRALFRLVTNPRQPAAVRDWARQNPVPDGEALRKIMWVADLKAQCREVGIRDLGPWYRAAFRSAAWGHIRNANRNFPIQGGQALLLLEHLANLDRVFTDHPDWRPVLTVHDSWVVEVPAPQVETYCQTVEADAPFPCEHSMVYPT